MVENSKPKNTVNNLSSLSLSEEKKTHSIMKEATLDSRPKPPALYY
jgi:hypothetical protein